MLTDSCRTHAVSLGAMPAIYVEPWPATMSGPYLVPEEDDIGEGCAVVEDSGDLDFHDAHPDDAPMARVAFVDGVRRADARLYQRLDDGHMVHGIAGAHGHGAVLCEPGRRPAFERVTTHHLVVWGSGVSAPLPHVMGGWSWEVRSVAEHRPDAPLQGLQRFMREAEGYLAEELADEGWLTIVDGPLNFVRSRDRTVIGYVKTHHRALLSADLHALVPNLRAGQRSSLFAKRSDIYSCYLRIGPPPSYAGLWAGIARLEFPASVGLDVAIEAADRATAMLPRFAGVAHTDPRAPQNLQPVSKLESHLHRRLGDAALSVRAVRRAAISATRMEER